MKKSARENLLPADGLLTYQSNFLAPNEAEKLFSSLEKKIAWQEVTIKIFGKEINQPRLVAWHNDPGISYTYSGITWQESPWLAEVQKIREKVVQATQVKFNSVLLNFYRGGKDSMGWHADDEAELGKNPCIASLTLGATRKFKLRHNKKDLQLDLFLESGSFLVMSGETQHFWKHAVPKTAKNTGPRINLTFRKIIS